MGTSLRSGKITAPEVRALISPSQSSSRGHTGCSEEAGESGLCWYEPTVPDKLRAEDV